MGNEYDPYREALVMETATIWPADFSDWDAARREALAEKLHGDPQHAKELEYIRTHTGFCRQIKVCPEDVSRLGE